MIAVILKDINEVQLVETPEVRARARALAERELDQAHAAVVTLKADSRNRQRLMPPSGKPAGGVSIIVFSLIPAVIVAAVGAGAVTLVSRAHFMPWFLGIAAVTGVLCGVTIIANNQKKLAALSSQQHDEQDRIRAAETFAHGIESRVAHRSKALVNEVLNADMLARYNTVFAITEDMGTSARTCKALFEEGHRLIGEMSSARQRRALAAYWDHAYASMTVYSSLSQAVSAYQQQIGSITALLIPNDPMIERVEIIRNPTEYLHELSRDLSSELSAVESDFEFVQVGEQFKNRMHQVALFNQLGQRIDQATSSLGASIRQGLLQSERNILRGMETATGQIAKAIAQQSQAVVVGLHQLAEAQRQTAQAVQSVDAQLVSANTHLAVMQANGLH